MGNVNYDSSLSFGSLDMSGSGTALPDIINLGKANIGNMRADVFAAEDIAGGTAVTVTVQCGPDGSSGWVDIGKNTFTLDQLKAGVCSVVLSPGEGPYLRVAVAKTGTFTAGVITGNLVPYAGK
ncbi:MAG: hypothetical protein LBQ35_07095 [Spirochaetaceae bacterium]|jgi:hypothetical protein|nr:hypothetical protein [Spirochaetaceae bacterium]